MEELQQVIQRIRNGEHEAFREIIKEYGPMVRVYLSGHIRDFQDVEELSQEIFVAIYWNLDSYDPKYSFTTWVRSISRNKMMSYFRRRYSLKNSVNELRVDILENLPDPSEPTHHATSRVLGQLQECIKKQPDRSSELIQARYFNRETVMDIAARLSTTEDAITSRLYRIRKQLKACIEGGLAS